MTDLRTISVMAGGQRLALRPHAVERYQERVRPALTLEQAAEDLERTLQLTEFGERPDWASKREWNEAGWLLLGDAIAFPVIDGRILTCLTRGEVGAAVRVVRQEQRQEFVARGNRPGTKKKHGKVARDQRRRARDAREAMSDGR